MSHARHKKSRMLGVVGRRFLAGALTLALSAGIVPAAATAGVAIPLAASAGITQVASADTVGQDISRWQGSISIGALGSFVIVKQSGSDIGYLYKDSMYARNAKAVRAAGKGLGHYYFNGYANPTSAANYFVSNLVEYQKGDPLVYDAEGSSFVSPAAVAAWVAQVRARLGADANVYVYMSSSVTRAYNWSSVAASGVKLWV
ncbi:MAG: GH25 family lysozyme, partial [Bifidobacterium sp.]